MDRKIDWNGLTIFICIVGIFFMLGILVGGQIKLRQVQDEAIKRGYARMVVEGRNAVFKWIDEDLESK
jgi:hypothetical protein